MIKVVCNNEKNTFCDKNDDIYYNLYCFICEGLVIVFENHACHHTHQKNTNNNQQECRVRSLL